jgi:hypothetical protein
MMSRFSGLFSSVFAWKDWGETSKSIIQNSAFPTETNLGAMNTQQELIHLCVDGRVNWLLFN